MTDKPKEPIDLLKRRTEKLLGQERHRKEPRNTWSGLDPSFEKKPRPYS